MTTVAEVMLWGTTIGAVSLDDTDDTASFEYSSGILGSGIEVAPLTMPLSKRIYRFPALSRPAFKGLPGLVADSLPDKFGNAVIDAWLARQGRTPESFNAIERLCYTGTRGMGALEYGPMLSPRARSSELLDVSKLVELASTVLAERENVSVVLQKDTTEEGLSHILRVGTSAGGARAKAVIAWNPATNEVRSGQVLAPTGFEYWLIKFDGVSANRDKELSDPKGYGAIEYAYYLMAVDAGITMMPCRLLEENGRRHFMTRRFDRTTTGQKIHMQSLGALAHFDYNAAGSYSYEQVFSIARRIGLTIDSIEELFRRMIFNMVARNQDDHVKNIAFLMDRNGQWQLAPAFDVVYSYQPTGMWTGRHQMSINGKRDGFDWNDIKEVSRVAGLKRGKAESLSWNVYNAVTRWENFALEAGVSLERIPAISSTIRLSLKPPSKPVRV